VVNVRVGVPVVRAVAPIVLPPLVSDSTYSDTGAALFDVTLAGKDTAMARSPATHAFATMDAAEPGVVMAVIVEGVDEYAPMPAALEPAT